MNSVFVRSVNIGDEVSLPVKMDKGTQILKGTVSYIHPQKRFFRVEFETGLGVIRECYPFTGPIESGKERGRDQ